MYTICTCMKMINCRDVLTLGFNWPLTCMLETKGEKGVWLFFKGRRE